MYVSNIHSRRVSEQFVMEETIWSIISRHIVVQQKANFHLLLGVACFEFTHCLIALFKLSTCKEIGWDRDRQRIDVIKTLDRTCEIIDRIPATLGMVDANGRHRDIFLK